MKITYSNCIYFALSINPPPPNTKSFEKLDIYTTLKAKTFLQLEFLVPISDVFYLELFGVAILTSTQAVVRLYGYYL